MSNLSELSRDELWKLNTALKSTLLMVLMSKPEQSALHIIASEEVKELVECIEEIEEALGISQK